MIVGVLLAAGAATRFGGGKLLQSLHGTPLAVASARNLKAALDRVVAVVRPGDCALRDILTRETGVEVVECARAHEGMGASLACAVAATREAQGWVVALADMPLISPRSIRAVVESLRGGARLSAPEFNGRRGHPVGIGSRFRDELLTLSGDAGAREILRAHAADLQLIPTDDSGVLADIDTPEDLRRLSR